MLLILALSSINGDIGRRQLIGGVEENKAAMALVLFQDGMNQLITREACRSGQHR